jgi:hypothetical protein
MAKTHVAETRQVPAKTAPSVPGPPRGRQVIQVGSGRGRGGRDRARAGQARREARVTVARRATILRSVG